MANDRVNPCDSYVCKGADCLRGRLRVEHNRQCQTCAKYRPRKTGNPRVESVKSRRLKSKERDAKKQIREY